ncbi:MAG TPA: transporter [Xanthomonadaceae bacterium]|nr:transporter [Xanthomonadaceae bacterium]
MNTRIAMAALVSGLLFGAGLVVSDMANPARVLAFLDVAGDWDPTLAFVMGAALVPSALAFAWCRRREAPLCDARFHLPDDRRPVDPRLITGAVLFGVGWGLVGLCPGPAVIAILTLQWPFLLFAAAMLAGIAAHRLLHPPAA